MILDILDSIQTQVFQMEWLHELVDSLLFFIGVSIESKVGASLQFFFHDLIKILLLLSILIFIISYIQSYFPPEHTKKILGKYKGLSARVVAAFFGSMTPFCCCSSIPIFIGFVRAGLPIGITFSFLISSPFVDLASLFVLGSIFGWKIAVTYTLVGIILAVIGGTYLEKMGMEKYLEDFSEEPLHTARIGELTQQQRIKLAYDQAKSTVKRLFMYIVLGLFIGALIYNWVPSRWIENIIGVDNPFAVIIATIISIPLHGDAFGIIPIAEALFEKNVGIGTVLAFMMGITGLSIPSLIMIRKIVKLKLFIAFIGIIFVGIIIIGYVLNILQGYLT